MTTFPYYDFQNAFWHKSRKMLVIKIYHDQSAQREVDPKMTDQTAYQVTLNLCLNVTDDSRNGWYATPSPAHMLSTEDI